MTRQGQGRLARAAIAAALFAALGCGSGGAGGTGGVGGAGVGGAGVGGAGVGGSEGAVGGSGVGGSAAGGAPAAGDAGGDAVDARVSAADVAADVPAPVDGLPPGLKVVMVTNGTATLSAGDTVMAGRLRARGFVVTFTSDVAVTAAAVAGQDLIVISSSAESGPLGTKIRDVARPIVCIENGAFPTMGLAATRLAVDYGSTFNLTAIDMVAAPSPLTAGLTGSVTITSMPAELGWAVPPAAALIGATMTGDRTHAALFAYARGAQMVGLVAPARRVGFAIRETAAANLTAQGLTLFDAAVSFALGD